MSFPVLGADSVAIHPHELADVNVSEEDRAFIEAAIPFFGPWQEDVPPQYMCSLFKDGNCSIYDNRPGTCVRHPVYPVPVEGSELLSCNVSGCTVRLYIEKEEEEGHEEDHQSVQA
jgi:Fe-S-cluster containining protein